jgi:hypothetical protein
MWLAGAIATATFSPGSATACAVGIRRPLLVKINDKD